MENKTNNFLQVSRPIECSKCHPEKEYLDCDLIFKQYGIKCKCICHEQPMQNPDESMQEDKPSQDWEVQLKTLPSDEGGTAIERMHPTDIDKVFDFIRNLLSLKTTQTRTALLEEVREMLGGMKKVIPKTVNMTPYPDDLIRAFAIEEQGYNKALDELLSRLSEIK
mgnify:FL=1